MAGIGINLHTQESKFETLEEAKSNNSVPETNAAKPIPIVEEKKPLETETIKGQKGHCFCRKENKK